MNIKTNVRAGQGSNSNKATSVDTTTTAPADVQGSSKAAGSVVTYISPLAAAYTSRCTGI